MFSHREKLEMHALLLETPDVNKTINQIMTFQLSNKLNTLCKCL